MKKKKFKAVVVGVGNIGADEKKFSAAVSPGTHAGAYWRNPDIELVAFVDVDQDNLKAACKKFPGVKAFTSIEQMFKNFKPDIISVATPTQYHHEGVMAIAKYGCRVILCEKPMSYSVKHARDMIAVCQKKGIKLFINHQRHFDPLLLQWSRRVKNENYLGAIYQGHAYFYNGLYNNGTHLLDLMTMFLGKPTSVAGYFNKKIPNNALDPNIDGLVFLKNDSLVSLHSLSKNYGYFSLTLLGEKGMIEITNLGYEVNLRKKTTNTNFKGFFSLDNKVLNYGQARSLMAGTIKYLVAYLRREVPAQSTGQDGLVILQALAALTASAKAGGRIIKINYEHWGGHRGRGSF